MGVAVSKNESTLKVFNEVVNETLNQSIVQIAQQSVSTIAPTQLVKIRAVAGGNLDIGGIQQKAIANIDVSKFLSSVTETQLKSMMSNAVKVAAKDNQEIDHQLTIGGSYGSNVSAAETYNKNVNRIVNSYSYSQFVSDTQSILASQTIDISGVASGDVRISNIDQYIKAEIISKQVAEHMASAFAEIQTESSLDVKKETAQKSASGLSMGWIALIIIVIVVLALIGGAVWYFYGGGKEMVQEMMKEPGGGGGGGGGLFS